MISKQGKIDIVGSVFLLLFWAGSVMAQPKYLQLNQYGLDDGLSSSIITCINQDKNGFIWIGTRDGLNRFDGDQFKVYKNNEDEDQVHTLPDNLILDLCLGNEDQLYVGTTSGLGVYEPELDKFHNFKNDSTSCLFELPMQARAVLVDSVGSVYICSTNGLYYFNTKQNTYHQYTTEDGFISSVINDVFLAADNRLWISSNRGLYVLNTKTNELEHINIGLNDEDYSNVRFEKIVADHSGIIWVASYADGLFMVDRNGEGKERLKNFAHDPNDPNSISKNRLLGLEVDRFNNLWMGAENDGIYCLNEDRKTFKHYLSSKTDPLVAKTYSVESIFIDSGDNMWIGTYANGLNVAPKNSESIVSFTQFKGGDPNNSNNVVNAFYELNDSMISIATDGGGINIFNKKTGFFESVNTSNSKLPNDYILSIAEDNRGNYWMATWGAGLLYNEAGTDELTVYNSTNSPLPDNNLFHVCAGNNSDVLIATFYSGLVYFSPELNKWEIYNSGNSSFRGNYVNVIRKADDGSFYVGTNSGLYRFYPDRKEMQECVHGDEIEMLQTAHVYDVFVEDNTSVWVGTLTGLIHFNPKSGDSRMFTTNEGLPANTVNGILKDANGFMWFSTSKGICRVNENYDKFDTYYKYDGLQGDEFRPRSVLIDCDNNLYFGGVNGFSIIFPDKLKKNTRAPEIKFTELEIFNKPILPNESASPLKRILAETQELKLNFSQSVLTFHFSVLDYTNPEKNQHAYLLENFDNDWTYCGTRRQVTYTNLDPGKYILRVKGANSDGVWNEEGIALEITIVPPWWRTWWFIVILFVFVVGLFWFVNHVRINALEKQKQKLELAVKNRTKELAEINATKDKLFSVIAHDLRNPFNVILGYTDVLIEGYDNFDKKMMNQILANLKSAGDSAFALLENLMSWSRSQRGIIEFLPRTVVLTDFLDSALLEVDAVAKKKEINVIDQVKDETISIYVDYNMMLLIFRNLLTNAIKFSKLGTEILIKTGGNDGRFITIGIEDQGIGMDAEAIRVLFQPGKLQTSIGTKGEKGSGLGLMLCKEFIEKHKGKIWVESTLGKGSVFWFTMPLTEKVFEK
ncbi:two-component regulator propeller domain-containing protein [Draconibacterium sp. IB214405]|uniref:ligand-binding sensor domain-containing protein n=1 Tax=Draconibacterium sp. IB214405 TaxID=3097352 RepID=UPI002A139A44|nr:two-component regulator propeller domain-containing protein [Draconibacterium sp. IB214405]MDX8337710.1 two-component regulator propeller domain-containing protein [Draconibacterium sp. IB214405]